MTKIKNNKGTLIMKSKKITIGLFITFVVIAIYNLGIDVNTCDDKWFSVVLSETNSSLSDYLVMRWNTWTSRIVIEAIMVPLTMLNGVIWKFLNVLIWVNIVIMIVKIFEIENDEDCYLLCLILLLFYPIMHMSSAGWIATSLNYSWPLSIGLYILYYVKRIVEKKNISVVGYILAIIGSFFAFNQEQMCAIATVILLLSIIKAFFEKAKWISIIPFFLISIMNLFAVVIAPGNALRKEIEIANWMPEYSNYNLLEKLYLGFQNMMNHFCCTPNIILGIFVATIFVIYIKKNKSIASYIIGYFPILYLTIFIVFPDNNPITTVFSGLNSIETIKSISGVVNFILAVAFVVCLLLQCISIFDDIEKKIIIVLILGAGFCSSIVLGFSPTLYASGERIFLFQYFSFIFGELFVVKQKQIKLPNQAVIFIVALLGLQIFRNILMII